MKAGPLYIEIFIHCTMDVLWQHTQQPALHQQWDLRFTSISYLPKVREEDAQQFDYSTQIGFGLKVSGQGESLGARQKGNGESTSVLKFWSASPISIIKEGSGYWKYIPQQGGIRFITGYDYRTRWGIAGQVVDALMFRPLMGWATALSFDALRLWLEQGMHPYASLRQAAILLCCRISLALIWIYHGLVPKLLYTGSGELELLQSTGLVSGWAHTALALAGTGEVLLGLWMLLRHQPRGMYWFNIVALIALSGSAFMGSPQVFVQPFNPVTLTLGMLGLCAVALLCLNDRLPRAAHCLRKPIKK